MNERIQQLAEQAKDSVPAGLLVNEWIDKYNQIFASLIVRECAELCTDPVVVLQHWGLDSESE
jgi:hypothetical protein